MQMKVRNQDLLNELKSLQEALEKTIYYGRHNKFLPDRRDYRAEEGRPDPWAEEDSES